MHSLGAFEKELRRNVRWVLLFSLTSNMFLIALPIYMLQIYDRILHSGSVESLLMITLVVVCALCLYGIVDSYLSRLFSALGRSFSETVGPEVMRRSVASPGDSGAHPIDSVDDVRKFFNSRTPSTVVECLWIPIFLGIVFLFHPLLGFVGVLGAGGLLLVAIIGDRKLRNRHDESIERKQSGNRFARSITRNRDTVLAHGMTGTLASRWSIRYSEASEAGAARYATQSDIAATSRTFRLLVQVALLGLGAYLAIRGSISSGMIVASSLMMARALSPFERALPTWRGLERARVSYAETKRLLTNEPIPVRRNLGTEQATIMGRGIRVISQASSNAFVTPAAIDIGDFQVDAGEILAIVGPNGSGKTTLLRAAVGLHPLEDGRITVGDLTLDGAISAEFGGGVSYIAQDPQFLPGTIARNISRFQKVDEQAMQDALALSRVDLWVGSLRAGVDTAINSDGSPLSPGQRQQVALARALYGGPQFLFMDEPTARLDVIEEAAFARLLRFLKDHGRTVILVTHSQRILRECDRMIVLHQERGEFLSDRKSILARTQQSGGRPGKLGDAESETGLAELARGA